MSRGHVVFRPLAVLLLLAAGSLLCGGCLSAVFGRTAGDEMIWYCDRCGEQVAGPETHVCGMTEYNRETGRDELIEGFTREEYEEEIARRQPTSHPAESDRPGETPRRRSPRWMFWRR